MTAFTRSTRWSAAPLLSLVLLFGIRSDWLLFHLPSGNPGQYHARVRRVADQLPYRIGDWLARDVDIPPAAQMLLKPNVLVGRSFHNASTDESATFILVQCEDAHDMGGHYPPKCYPAHGWDLHETWQRELRVMGTPMPVSIYRFTFEAPDRFAEILVYNFFVRPDGALDSGREGLRDAAVDPRRKVFGAAQVQVVFDRSLSPQRMDEVFATLVGGAFPVVEAIRDGDAP